MLILSIFLLTGKKTLILNREDPNSQTVVQQANVNTSLAKRIVHQEPVHKPISKGHISSNNDFSGPRNYPFNSNLQNYGSGSKSHSKTRKNTTSGSKERTLSETKALRSDNTLPQISQRRGVSPVQSFENKSYNTPIKHVQHIQLTTHCTQTPSESDKHEEIEYKEHIAKEQAKNYPLEQQIKSSHPLKEIKIDITNLEQTTEGQRASTSRNKLQGPLFSQRPEKESQSKSIKGIRGTVTPQGVVSRSNKQRFLVNGTPKQDVPNQTQTIKRPQFKNILTEEERKHYGDRFLDDYEKVDFLGR